MTADNNNKNNLNSRPPWNSGDNASHSFQLRSDSSVSKEVTDGVMQFADNFKNLTTPIFVIASNTFVLYLIGTNHANPQCQEDVAAVIRTVKPKSVVLELCISRICRCPTHRNSIFQTSPQFGHTYLKKAMNEIGTIPGMIFFADVYREKQLSAEQIYLDYGGEMVRTILEANAIGSDVILGDRPIEITLQRQGKVLSQWKKIQLMSQVNLAMKLRKWKKEFLARASKIVFQDPKAFHVLTLERDLYLTYSIQKAVLKRFPDTERTTVVAVVGQGHLSGILKFLGKVTPEVIEHVSTVGRKSR